MNQCKEINFTNTSKMKKGKNTKVIKKLRNGSEKKQHKTMVAQRLSS